MQCSYVIVQLLSSWRLQGFKRRPSLPLRQGLTPPLPLWRGLWPSQIGTAWASALPSLPAADIRVTSWAERRSAGDTGEGDSEGEGNIHGQEPTYCVHSLLLCYFFTHPSPILTYFFIFYTPTHWLRPSHFSLPFVHFCLQTRFCAIYSSFTAAALTTTLSRYCTISSIRQAITMLFMGQSFP